MSDNDIKRIFELLHPGSNNDDIKIYQILNYYEMLDQLNLQPKTKDDQDYLMFIHGEYMNYVFTYNE